MNKTLSFYAASAAATWKLRSISSDATDALEQCVKSDPAMLYANSRACMSRARSRCRPTAGRGRVRAALRGGCSRAARALLDSEGPGPGGGEGGGGGHAPRRDRVAQRKRRWRLLLRGPRGRSAGGPAITDEAADAPVRWGSGRRWPTWPWWHGLGVADQACARDSDASPTRPRRARRGG